MIGKLERERSRMYGSCLAHKHAAIRSGDRWPDNQYETRIGREKYQSGICNNVLIHLDL